jgi:DNA-binding XRE family transcriptional regulator
MEGKTNVQIVSEKCRALYEIPGSPPLLQQVIQVYRITIREFAATFGISKFHAEDIIKQRKFPSTELAIRICRYFECSVEELFGWRVDDDGKRRPLLRVDPKTNTAYRLSERDPKHETMALVREKIKGVASER